MVGLIAIGVGIGLGLSIGGATLGVAREIIRRYQPPLQSRKPTQVRVI